METKFHIGRKEKRQEFWYLLLLFFAISLLLVWVIFRNSGSVFSPVSSLESNYMLQSQEFDERQKEAIPLYDTLFNQVTALQNMHGNMIIETDIKNGINTLNNLNENLPSKDARFIAFHQMALFLKLYYEDMMVLKRKKENVALFQDQLNQCEIGYKDGQTLMNQIKAAQAAKTNQ